MARAVRWGHVRELDRRMRVGSPGYRTLPARLKHLMSWRAMHLVGNGHASVRGYATQKRTRPSSDLPLRHKESYVIRRS